LYFYGIKIQTNIKKNLVEKYMKKITDFDENFFWNFFLTGRNRPRNLGWARIDPAQSPLE
jgi:hypothetical protein